MNESIEMSNSNDEDLIDLYLADGLSEQACDALEKRLLSDKNLQNQVVQARLLYSSMKDEQQSLLADSNLSLMNRLHQIVTSNVWSYAASIVALVGISTFWFSGQSADPSIIDDIVFVETMRDSGEPHSRPIISAGSHVALSFDASIFLDEPVQLEITIDGEHIQSMANIIPNRNQEVNVLVPALTAGSYKIRLFSENAGETVLFLEVE